MKVLKVHKDSKLFKVSIKILNEKYDYKNRNSNFWVERYSKTKLDYIGFLLKIENTYAGFLGVIGSSDRVGLSVWYVDPVFRKYSLTFLIKSINMLGTKSIINSSPNSTALKIFLKMKGFRLENEYVGIPKKIFGGFSSNKNIYEGKRINVLYSKNPSIYDIVYLTLKNKKLTLALTPSSNSLFYKKKNKYYI